MEVKRHGSQEEAAQTCKLLWQKKFVLPAARILLLSIAVEVVYILGSGQHSGCSLCEGCHR